MLKFESSVMVESEVGELVKFIQELLSDIINAL